MGTQPQASLLAGREVGAHKVNFDFYYKFLFLEIWYHSCHSYDSRHSDSLVSKATKRINTSTDVIFFSFYFSKTWPGLTICSFAAPSIIISRGQI